MMTFIFMYDCEVVLAVAARTEEIAWQLVQAACWRSSGPEDFDLLSWGENTKVRTESGYRALNEGEVAGLF